MYLYYLITVEQQHTLQSITMNILLEQQQGDGRGIFFIIPIDTSSNMWERHHTFVPWDLHI